MSKKKNEDKLVLYTRGTVWELRPNAKIAYHIDDEEPHPISDFPNLDPGFTELILGGWTWLEGSEIEIGTELIKEGEPQIIELWAKMLAKFFEQQFAELEAYLEEMEPQANEDSEALEV